MNTQKGKSMFNNFIILLNSGQISAIIMERLIHRITSKKDAVMHWNTQAGKITTNLKVKIYSTLPELSATKIVTWNCHVGDCAKCRYDMILSRNLLTDLSLNLKLSDHVIESNDGPFKGSTAPMFHVGEYEFKEL